MLKMNLILETFKDKDFADLYVNEQNKDIDFTQDIKLEKINDTIEYYLNKYNLTNEVMITHNVYKDDFLYTSITEPVANFLQRSDY
jgi:hypothetical protein